MSDWVEKALKCAKEIKDREVKSWSYKKGIMRYTAGEDKREFAVPPCFFYIVKNALALWAMQERKNAPPIQSQQKAEETPHSANAAMQNRHNQVKNAAS